MRTMVASVVAAAIASLCCWGPVVLTLAGAGAASAAVTRFEPYRPYLIAVTLVLLGAAFYTTYRPGGQACDPQGACTPATLRRRKRALWIAAVVIGLLLTFPYYANRLF